MKIKVPFAMFVTGEMHSFSEITFVITTLAIVMIIIAVIKVFNYITDIYLINYI